MKTFIEEPAKDKTPAFYPGLYMGVDSPIILELLAFDRPFGSGVVRRANDTHEVGFFSNSWDLDGFVRMPVGTKLTIVQE